MECLQWKNPPLSTRLQKGGLRSRMPHLVTQDHPTAKRQKWDLSNHSCGAYQQLLTPTLMMAEGAINLSNLQLRNSLIPCANPAWSHTRRAAHTRHATATTHAASTAIGRESGVTAQVGSHRTIATWHGAPLTLFFILNLDMKPLDLQSFNPNSIQIPQSPVFFSDLIYFCGSDMSSFHHPALCQAGLASKVQGTHGPR